MSQASQKEGGAEACQESSSSPQARGRSPARPRGPKGGKGGAKQSGTHPVPEELNSLIPEGAAASANDAPKQASTRTPTPGRKGGKKPDKDKPCYNMLSMGSCRFGDSCRYSHDPEVIAQAKAQLEKGKGKGKDQSES